MNPYKPSILSMEQYTLVQSFAYFVLRRQTETTVEIEIADM